jgi:hypothetical protein
MEFSPSPNAESSEDVSSEVTVVPVSNPENLPGAMPEVHVPMAVPTLDAAPALQPQTDSFSKMYSPRASFVPPDVEAAIRHAKENRPMMLNDAGQLVPYVSIIRHTFSAHLPLPQVPARDAHRQHHRPWHGHSHVSADGAALHHIFFSGFCHLPPKPDHHTFVRFQANWQHPKLPPRASQGVQVRSSNTPSPPSHPPPRSIASLFSGNFTVTDEVSPANVGCTRQHCVLCSPSACYKLDSNTVAVAIANLDLLNCLLFFFLSIYFSRWIDKRDKEVNDATLTPSDFTLRVDNLADDTTIDDVQQAFSSNYKLPGGSGSCALVRIAYDESKFLSAFIKQSKLSESFENAEAACCRSDSAKNRNALAKCRALMSKNSVCDHSSINVQFKFSDPQLCRRI